MALSDNLIGYWKLDESSGNAVDEVNSNDAVNTGVTYTTGALNNCADFNAATDVLYVGNPAAVQLSGAHTVSFWLNAAAPAGLVSMIFKGGVNSAADMNWGLMKYAGGSLQYWVSSGSGLSSVAITDANADADFFNSSWNHIVYQYTPSTKMEVFLNGSSYASETTGIVSAASTTKGLSFGRITTSQSATARDSVIGKMDEIGIWSRVLTGAEITTLYNSGTPYSYADIIGGGGGYRFVPQLRPFAGL